MFAAALFVKGVLVSMAGPTPNYAIQHVLSTRSPREAALENLVMAIVSLGPRFPADFWHHSAGHRPLRADLASMGSKPDFEQILPKVVVHDLPVGCKGLLVAALVAAFMSTFVSTANSGVAYIVNDIYRRYVNPKASQKKLVAMGYLWTILVIAAGIGIGFTTDSIHHINRWLTAALVPAFVMPNVLKWHWWRFNGWGFFAGMVAGTLAAVTVAVFPLHETISFMLILLISGLASVVACLLTPPEDTELLMEFYTTVRPWGVWGPILRRCQALNPSYQPNRAAARDGWNILVGIVWQIALVAGPLYLVIQQWGRMWACAGVFGVTSIILKFTWYDKLGPGQMYMTADGNAPADAPVEGPIGHDPLAVTAV